MKTYFHWLMICWSKDVGNEVVSFDVFAGQKSALSVLCFWNHSTRKD